MNEQPQEAYLKLINALLGCPSGQEAEILSTNRELIDAEFVEIMKQVAAVLTDQGDHQAADFLIHVARYLAEALSLSSSTPTSSLLPNSNYQLDLLLEVLQATADSKDNPQFVYPLLQANLDKLDDNFANVMRCWATATLPEVEPEQAQYMAAVIADFSDLILEFALGNRTSNLEIAITGYEVAATVLTREASPQTWASLQTKLRAAFLSQVLLVAGESNGERRREKLYPLLEENSDKLDDNFANVLRELATTRLSEAPPDIALGVATRIGNFCNVMMDFSRGNRASNLEIAITGFNAIATVFTPIEFPERWAQTQNNLGNAYFERIRENRAENLEKAIRCYEAALQVRTLERCPRDWAETQTNLGAAYCERVRGERAQNLEQAIDYYGAALEVYTLEEFPKEWAATQTNLGNAYLFRILGDREENLEHAIACYQNALQVRTQQDYPKEWAMIQNNLGDAYLFRIRGDREENLEHAIACYQNALQVRTQKNYPQDWATTKQNLGTAYSDRIRGNPAKNLELAIVAYQDALKVYTRNDFPQRWATIKIGLGGAYLEQVFGNQNQIRSDQAKNLQLAIAEFQDALSVFTPREDFPEEWAKVQTNLGNAYFYSWQIDRASFDEGQIDQAIACYRSALEVYEPTAFPVDCLLTAGNLGTTAFAAKRWAEAIEGYSVAIEAVETSRAWASTDRRGQDTLSNAIEVYANMVQACINNEQLDKAIEYVERSKARNLVELIATRDIYPKGDISKTVLNELKRLRREIVTEQLRLDIVEQNRLRSIMISGIGAQMGDSVTWLKDRTHLNELLKELDDLITNYIAPIDPRFRATQQVEPISFKAIVGRDGNKSLLDDRTAILECYITNDRFYTFIITRQSEHPKVWPFSAEEGGDLEELNNWFNEYLQDYQQNREQWRTQISEHLQRLAKILHLDDILNFLPATCDQLILIPHRFLHLIPLHALPRSERCCLLDGFPRGVRYAPSCQLLQLNSYQQRPNLDRFFAIQNPTKDLNYASVEVKSIQHCFPQNDVLVEEDAKKEAIVEVKDKDDNTREVILNPQLGLANCVHFSCHGEFNFKSPLESALLLANYEPLTLGEIFVLDFPQCRLVTLSACETGITNYKILSDEYIGIPSGFLYAGSPSLVSSLWTVSDLSTAFLMIEFYQNLRSSLTVAIALNQAQRWLRDVTKKELEAWISRNQLPLSPTDRIHLRHRLHKLQDDAQPFQEPFYWAAFCAIGQ